MQITGDKKIDLGNGLVVPYTAIDFGENIGMIYVLINELKAGVYKIGFTTDFIARIKQLNVMDEDYIHPKMVFAIKGGGNFSRSDEDYLHDTFVSKRLKGEWFALTGNDLLFIHDYLLDRGYKLCVDLPGYERRNWSLAAEEEIRAAKNPRRIKKAAEKTKSEIRDEKHWAEILQRAKEFDSNRKIKEK